MKKIIMTRKGKFGKKSIKSSKYNNRSIAMIYQIFLTYSNIYISYTKFYQSTLHIFIKTKAKIIKIHLFRIRSHSLDIFSLGLVTAITSCFSYQMLLLFSQSWMNIYFIFVSYWTRFRN